MYFIMQNPYPFLPNPCYVLEERLLRRNLELIRDIAQRADVEFILAFKAFALWKTFPIFKEYITHTTASSPWEARLALEEFGSRAHTYSPAYEDETFDEILRCSSHITFNSMSQAQHFLPKVEYWNDMFVTKSVSCGLRINPEASEIETALYDPCAPGSRFGITADQLPEELPRGIDGFHCHCHCESDSHAFEHTLQHIEEKFGSRLAEVKWLNLGGGHLVTRQDYDVEHLIGILTAFKARHPHLKIILEPGSAFAWQTGPLVSKVVDIVENHGIKTAILNVSFTCHMPDCLEMPYWPKVRGAKTIEHHPGDPLPAELAQSSSLPEGNGGWYYRLGGNSCLSGDFMGFWQFDHELTIGETIVLEDMIHYTTVKTCTFNGIQHPAIAIIRQSGEQKVLRQYFYNDYRDRMD